VRRNALVYIAVVSVLSLLVVAAIGCRPEQKASARSPVVGRSAPPPQATTLPAEKEAEATMQLTSPAFGNGQRLRNRYAREHRNLSPPLQWSGVPEQAVELAVICDDPDALAGTWTHWLIWGLSADRTELPAGVEAKETLPDLAGATQGTNDFGDIGYGGPQPPVGTTHRYSFRLYALSEPLALHLGANASEVHAALEGKVLAEAQTMGTYSR